MILFIYGAKGAGVEVYDLVKRNKELSKKYSAIYFIDDFSEEKNYYDTKTVPFTSCKKYIGNENAEFIIAVGEPASRKMLFEKIKYAWYSLET